MKKSTSTTANVKDTTNTKNHEQTHNKYSCNNLNKFMMQSKSYLHYHNRNNEEYNNKCPLINRTKSLCENIVVNGNNIGNDKQNNND